jgi:hypothetical protein
MQEQTRNVDADGLIQTLVSIGGQTECIASEEKHPKPELVEEDELKRAIQEMLIENTGCSIIDSGGAYGRGWERNRSRDFKNEESVAIEIWDDQVSIQYNTYKYLTNFLEITEESKKLDKLLQKAIELYDNDSYMTDMEDFMEEQEQDGYTDRDITNTYNYENILSEVLQYGILINDDTDEHFIILQIHNGCDVRGGYTRPRVFSVGTDDNFSYFLMAQQVITAFCEKCRMEWLSDDSGSNWYNDGNSGEQSGLRTATKQEEELKIVCDAKNNTVSHKNCGGKIVYEVLEQW